MKLHKLLINAVLGAALYSANLASAQLAAPNAAGISAGHTHLSVSDVAKQREIWKSFGAHEVTLGRLQLLAFPGIYILLKEQAPSMASILTSANHIGFTINDYEHYKQLLADAGATLFFDDPENGQILADLPDGVRVEFAVDKTQAEPIRFHHTHLAASDGPALRDWYVKVFGAEVGERRGLPSAMIPGGQVDFLPVRGDAPLPSQGTAIDHIGFEVADMDAFAARMNRLGISFDREPEYIDDIYLTIAFITDPAGTYIELTEGLDDAE